MTKQVYPDNVETATKSDERSIEGRLKASGDVLFVCHTINERDAEEECLHSMSAIDELFRWCSVFFQRLQMDVSKIAAKRLMLSHDEEAEIFGALHVFYLESDAYYSNRHEIANAMLSLGKVLAGKDTRELLEHCLELQCRVHEGHTICKEYATTYDMLGRVNADLHMSKEADICYRRRDRIVKELEAATSKPCVIYGVVDNCADGLFHNKLQCLFESLQNVRDTVRAGWVGWPNAETMAHHLRSQDERLPCLLWCGPGAAMEAVPNMTPDGPPMVAQNQFVADLIDYGVAIDVALLLMPFGAQQLAADLVERGVAKVVLCVCDNTRMRHATLADACVDLRNMCLVAQSYVQFVHEHDHCENVCEVVADIAQKRFDSGVYTVFAKEISSAAGDGGGGDLLGSSHLDLISFAKSVLRSIATSKLHVDMCVPHGNFFDTTTSSSDGTTSFSDTTTPSSDTTTPSPSSDTTTSPSGLDVAHLGAALDLTNQLEQRVYHGIPTVLSIQAQWEVTEAERKEMLPHLNEIIKYGCVSAAAISHVNFIHRVDMSENGQLVEALSVLHKQYPNQSGVVWLKHCRVDDSFACAAMTAAMEFCMRNESLGRTRTWMFVIATAFEQKDMWKAFQDRYPHCAQLLIHNAPLKHHVEHTMQYALLRLQGAAHADLADVRTRLLESQKAKQERIQRTIGHPVPIVLPDSDTTTQEPTKPKPSVGPPDWIGAMYYDGDAIVVNVVISSMSFLYELCNRVVFTGATMGEHEGFDFANMTCAYDEHVRVTAVLDTAYFSKVYKYVIMRFRELTPHQKKACSDWHKDSKYNADEVVHMSGHAGDL